MAILSAYCLTFDDVLCVISDLACACKQLSKGLKYLSIRYVPRLARTPLEPSAASPICYNATQHLISSKYGITIQVDHICRKVLACRLQVICPSVSTVSPRCRKNSIET
jgi:hypothetical protein